MNKTKAVVLGRNYSSLLGMIRAAGAAGCDVAVIRTVRNIPKGIKKKLHPEFHSKYVVKAFYAVEPNRQTILDLLFREFGNHSEKVILLPTDDFVASTIDLYQDVLKEQFLFPHIRHESGAVVALMDKNIQKELAAEAGLTVAKAWIVGVKDGQYTIPNGIEYPCFTKPQISFLGDKQCMKRCDSEQELTAVLGEVAKQGDCPILVEQYIEIEKEYGAIGYCDGENVVIPAVIDKIMIGSGKHKGVTLLGKVIPIQQFEQLQTMLSALMRKTQFVGLFDIDLYENNGIVYFNELNLRMGAFGYSVLCAGINLPEMLIRTLQGNKLEQVPKELEHEIKCLNDKVNLEDYRDGYIDFKEYNRRTKLPDFRFILSDEDKMPYQYFKLELLKQRLKRLLKR